MDLSKPTFGQTINESVAQNNINANARIIKFAFAQLLICAFTHSLIYCSAHLSIHLNAHLTKPENIQLMEFAADDLCSYSFHCLSKRMSAGLHRY